MRLPDVSALARRERFTIREPLCRSYDHDVFLIEQGGERRILKVITDITAATNIWREVTYCRLLHSLAETMPEVTFRTRTVLAAGDGWYVGELLDAPPLLDGDYGSAIPRLAAVLADFDALAPAGGAHEPQYRDPTALPNSCATQRLTELERWLDTIVQRGPLSRAEAGRTLEHLRATMEDVRPGFEMWDVKLDDFLDMPEDKVGVYDLEFAHLFGRRYYDLGRLYATLFCCAASRAFAPLLLGEFLKRTPRPMADIASSCLPVFAAQAVARLHDAVTGDADPALPRELLDRCRSGDLEALSGP
jgi:hypothetical protein